MCSAAGSLWMPHISRVASMATEWFYDLDVGSWIKTIPKHSKRKNPAKTSMTHIPHSHITPSHLWILQRSHPEKQATFTTTNSISHRLQKFFDCAGCPKLQGHLTKGPAHSESLMSNCLINSCILMSPQVYGIRIGDVWQLGNLRSTTCNACDPVSAWEPSLLKYIALAFADSQTVGICGTSVLAN